MWYSRDGTSLTDGVTVVIVNVEMLKLSEEAAVCISGNEELIAIFDDRYIFFSERESQHCYHFL